MCYADNELNMDAYTDYIQQADGEYTIPPKSNTVRPRRCESNAFSKNSSGSAESPLVMTSVMTFFLLLSFLLLSLFC